MAPPAIIRCNISASAPRSRSRATIWLRRKRAIGRWAPSSRVRSVATPKRPNSPNKRRAGARLRPALLGSVLGRSRLGLALSLEQLPRLLPLLRRDRAVVIEVDAIELGKRGLLHLGERDASVLVRVVDVEQAR